MIQSNVSNILFKVCFSFFCFFFLVFICKLTKGFNENEAVTFATTMQVTLPNGMVREDDRNSIDWTFKNEFRFNPGLFFFRSHS